MGVPESWPQALVPCGLLAVGGVLFCLVAVTHAAAPAKDNAEGEAAFYTDSNGVTVFTPTVGGTISQGAVSASGQYSTDIISAASVDIVSTASERWEEVRHEGALSVALQTGDSRVEVSGSTSVEPDYLSVGGRVLYGHAFDDESTLVFFYGSYAHDVAGLRGTPFSVYSLLLDRIGMGSSLHLTLDEATLLILGLDASFEAGDSSKPYRFLPLFSAEDAARINPGASLDEVNQLRLPGRMREAVPDQRHRFSLSGRLLRRFHSWTFVAMGRAYQDDWGMFGLTSESRALWDVTSRVRLSASARLHGQSGVFFWERAYVGAVRSGEVDVPRYRSGDRELSPLLTTTVGGGLFWGLARAAQPYRTTLSVQADGSHTRFVDALYLDRRWASLLLLQVGREF